eukprot:CAMPEP_0117592714 /NCGR_PEP_ID=MMETSP0784-20121206/72225_1 /TAXON_ID=39447 /ORGANISM="" /LENGTH=36 /DNA_ID= /DNA_START= /DNA_END= /DNA_ORIENTATION=
MARSLARMAPRGRATAIQRAATTPETENSDDIPYLR